MFEGFMLLCPPLFKEFCCLPFHYSRISVAFPSIFEETGCLPLHFSKIPVSKVPFSRKMVAISVGLSLKKPDFRRKSSKMTCSVGLLGASVKGYGWGPAFAFREKADFSDRIPEIGFSGAFQNGNTGQFSRFRSEKCHFLGR